MVITPRSAIFIILVILGLSGAQAGETYIHDPEPDVALGCGFFDNIPNAVDSTQWRWNLTDDFANISEATLTFRFHNDGDNETDRMKLSVSGWLWGDQITLGSPIWSTGLSSSGGGMYELQAYSHGTISFDVTSILQENLFMRVTVRCLGGPDFYFDSAELEVEGPSYGDTDGVPDEVEDLVPSASGDGVGDGNGDGAADGAQDHVASLRSHPEAPNEIYATIACDEGYPLSDVQSMPSGEPPQGWEFPYGAFSFRITSIPMGGTVNLKAMIPLDTNVAGIMKLDQDGVCRDITTALVHGPPEAPTKTVLAFQLVDGGPLDEDGEIDGSLLDDMSIGVEVVELTLLYALVPVLLVVTGKTRNSPGKRNRAGWARTLPSD